MFSACELILEGKAKPGDTVDLLWRDELHHPFTQRITFDGGGKAVSGPCTAYYRLASSAARDEVNFSTSALNSASTSSSR